MSELESRFRQAADADQLDQPSIGAITDRGTVRARNRQIAGGAVTAAVLAVGVFGVAPRLGNSSEVVDVADGTISVQLTDDNTGDTLVSFDDTEGTIGGELASSEDTATDDQDRAQGIGAVIVDQPRLCFSASGGEATLEIAANDDGGSSVQVLEFSEDAQVSDGEASFRGDGVIEGSMLEAVGRYGGGDGAEAADTTRLYTFTVDPLTATVDDMVYRFAACADR